MKQLSQLPVGSRFCDYSTTYYGAPVVWIVGEHNHIGYPANTVTLISKDILKLCPFDAREPSNPVIGRSLHGNNRYSLSNIRMWLNGSGSNWYTQAYVNDTPPTNAYAGSNAYAGEAGFLSGFSQTLRSKLIPTRINTAVPNTDGRGYEETTDSVFLLSEIEAGYTDDNSAEGYKIALFAAWGKGDAYPTRQAVSHCQNNDLNITSADPWYWVFRTPYTGDGFRVQGTFSGDNEPPYFANDSYNGIRPAINVADDLQVSDAPDENGIYYIGSAPVIPDDPGGGDDSEDSPETSGSIYDIGNVSETPSYTFGLAGEDLNNITATLKGPVQTEYTDNGDGTVTLTLDSTVFDNLKYGRYYMDIEITDGQGNKKTRKTTFTKVADAGETDNLTLIDLGSIDRPPLIEFAVSDNDIGQSLTVSQKIDGETVDEFTSAVRFARYTVTIAKNKWNELSYGRHTMTVTVTDSREAQAERYFVFVKTAGTGDYSGCACN